MFSTEQQRVLLEKYVQEAVDEMQRRIRSAGLIMTGEMLDSFKVSATESGSDFVSKKVSMADYVRLKDLRSMHYVRTPPLEAMKYFIESHGVHRFSYVPGYQDGWPASEEIAVRRLAWAFKMSMKRNPDVRRGYRGIYSSSVSKAMSGLKSSAGQEGARFAMRFVKNILTQ
ncbi:hypothetical protein [Runella sp.]|uniref:hypothetical protein n=1 Tax=Runella sp. TaxID=1960881 RepID=UPI003D1273DD